MPGWKLVTNHALVLCQIAQQPRINIKELSLTIGITEKAIHRIITDLETVGYVTKIREGRRLRYRINPDLCLRDEMVQDKAVSDLLRYLAGEDGAGQYRRENWLLRDKKQNPNEAVLVSQRVITNCVAGTVESPHRTFPLASEAKMPPKQRIAKIMKDVFILCWKSG